MIKDSRKDRLVRTEKKIREPKFKVEGLGSLLMILGSS